MLRCSSYIRTRPEQPMLELRLIGWSLPNIVIDYDAIVQR